MFRFANERRHHVNQLTKWTYPNAFFNKVTLFNTSLTFGCANLRKLYVNAATPATNRQIINGSRNVSIHGTSLVEFWVRQFKSSVSTTVNVNSLSGFIDLNRLDCLPLDM